MAQLLVRRGPNPKSKKLENGRVVNRIEEQNLDSWNQGIRSLWLHNVAAQDSKLFDCEISHETGHCRCKCTPFFNGERKK